MKHEQKGDSGEDYVNQLAYKSYLRFWCYPNPNDLSGDKKEICDLLISFRDILIIISVKNHNYGGNYERYKKKVIQKSTSQLNGAERLLFKSKREIHIKHPDREKEVFEPNRYSKVYKITINVGEQYEHYELSDSNSNGMFINILNKETFETIISELDTIKDFTDYLDERQKLLNENNINFDGFSEKDLLALYLTNARTFPQFTSELIQSLPNAWERYDKNNSTALKRNADRTSYFIDDLVKNDILKLPSGEILARELMNLSRTERRMVANTLFDLVRKNQDKPNTLARRYSAYNGIGHLFVYYPPESTSEEIDNLLQRYALPIYAYKTDFKEKEIILLAATKNLKNWKFGLFSATDFTLEQKKTLDKLIENFGWFKDVKTLYYVEKEYPDEV